MTEPASILIVDDDENIRQSFSTVLMKAGYEVEAAENGASAVAKSATRFYNLALIDIRLPDVEGIELITRLNKTNPEMVKIIVTGFPSVQNAVEAVNRGANGYIIKPAKMEELLKMINEHLKKQETARHYNEQKIKEFIETRIKEEDSK